MSRAKLSTILFFAILIIIGFFSFSQTANAANVNFTSGIWVKPSTSIASKAVLVKNNEIRLVTDASGKLSCQIHNGTAWQTAAVSASALSLNVWQYLSCSYDGANLKVFIDGKQDGSQAMTADVQNTTNPLYAGRDAGGTYGYFQGLIDSVHIYNYARTPDEILMDYNDGKAAHLGKDSQRDDGLVGYWNMEEGKGQTVYDCSGNGNNGTLGASTAVAKDDPVFTSGYSSAGAGGTALKFDGKDDYVDAGNGASLNITTTGNYTMEAWFKTNDVSKYQGILNFSDGVNNRNGIRFNNTYLVAGYYNGTAYIGKYISASTLSNNTWYHAALINSGGTISFYLNGVALNSTTGTSGLDNNSNKIGYSANSGYFSGSIDEVRIWNRALSADEIRQHYNQKKPILDMKFDEGSGTSTKDESFNNNDGTLYSGATSCSNPPTAGCPTWITGKYGSAIQFDGTDDYVNGGNGASLNITNAITIEAWVNAVSFSDPFNTKAIVAKMNTAASTPTAYNFYVTSSGNLDFIFYNGAWKANTPSSGAISTGSWYHVVVTYDQTKYKYYINGRFDSEFAETAAMVVNSYALLIGKTNNGYYYFNGTIDSVRIYNYARSASEILTDYNNGLAAHLR